MRMAAASGPDDASGSARAAARGAARRAARDELMCPICRDVMVVAVSNMGCLHRFCKSCIESSLRSKLECPACRVKVKSRRSLRPDNRYDELIKLLELDTDGGDGSDSDGEDMAAILAAAAAQYSANAERLRAKAKAEAELLTARGWFKKGALTKKDKKKEREKSKGRVTDVNMNFALAQPPDVAEHEVGGLATSADVLALVGRAGSTRMTQPESAGAHEQASRPLLQVPPAAAAQGGAFPSPFTSHGVRRPLAVPGDVLAPPADRSPPEAHYVVQVVLSPMGGARALPLPYLSVRWTAAVRTLQRWAEMQLAQRPSDPTLATPLAGVGVGSSVAPAPTRPTLALLGTNMQPLDTDRTVGDVAEAMADMGGQLRLYYRYAGCTPG